MLSWIKGLFRSEEPEEATCKCPWCSVWSPLRLWVETKCEDFSTLECPYCHAESFWDLDAPAPILLHNLAILPRDAS